MMIRRAPFLFWLCACAPSVAQPPTSTANTPEQPAPPAKLAEPPAPTEPAVRPAPTASLAPTESARPPEGINKRWVAISPERAATTLERDGREVFENREVVLAALDLELGQTAADIGAGTGFFVKMMANAVGPEGKVYGVDIAPALVEGIGTWAERSGTTHVEAVLGAPDDVRLPARSLDLVFISDTYHHFEAPPAIMATIHAAMKPGARLFVLDFERIPGTSPDWILEHVRAGKQTFIAELERSGFTYVKEHDVPELVENYLIELRR